jgi:hypothetical protein
LYTGRPAVEDLADQSMRRDLSTVLVALAVGAGVTVLILGSDREPGGGAGEAATALVVGWAYIGSGLAARRQRPENRLGAVMLFIGFAWFALYLADADVPLVFTLGTAAEDLALLGFVYLVLAFPTGRLRGRVVVVLVVTAAVLVTLVEEAWLLFADSHGAIASWLPLFLFVVLFALSMDYHVFILSRVKELVDGGMTTEDAVGQAITRTAGTVTSAAIVMVAVFAIFATLHQLDIKQMASA